MSRIPMLEQELRRVAVRPRRFVAARRFVPSRAVLATVAACAAAVAAVGLFVRDDDPERAVPAVASVSPDVMNGALARLVEAAPLILSRSGLPENEHRGTSCGPTPSPRHLACHTEQADPNGRQGHEIPFIATLASGRTGELEVLLVTKDQQLACRDRGDCDPGGELIVVPSVPKDSGG